MTTPKVRKALDQKISHLTPCKDARLWLAGYTSPAKAWRECVQGDWMLWILGRTNDSPPWSDGRKPLLACCLDVADTAADLRPTPTAKAIAEAVGVLRKWATGTSVSIEAVKQAGTDLQTVCYVATSCAAASYAAASCAAASYAAASYAAATSSAAACAAASYAVSAAADSASAKNISLTVSADIVRTHFPKPPKV